MPIRSVSGRSCSTMNSALTTPCIFGCASRRMMPVGLSLMIFALSRSARSRINASSPAGGSSRPIVVVIFKQISEPALNAKRMVSLTRCRPPTIGPDAKARCRFFDTSLTARAALATESYRFTCQRHKVAENINPSRLGPGLPAKASIPACTKDRNYNASCQRRRCRRYLIGRAGR